jgi:hypothetical protein
MSDQLEQIRNEQKKDGSFPDPSGLPSLIGTAFVLSCLNRCQETDSLAEEIRDIKDTAARFLLSQKNSDWKFSENTGVNFYVLSVLAEYNKELINGAAIAKILNGLISLEAEEGGPYYSEGISGKRTRAVIDPVTNASIARFLSSFDVELPHLTPFQNILDTEAKTMNAFHLALTPALSGAMSLSDVFVPVRSRKQDRIEAIRTISFDVGEQAMMDKIMKTAGERFRGLSPEFRNFAIQGIQKTMRGNRDKQMSLMAYYTKQALGKRARKVSDEMIAEMGLANIFFWTAFIIYDDFWDEDEAADPRILPTANLYARSYVDLFSSILPEKTGFRAFFHKVMDELDGANTWETLHCRTKVEGSVFTIPKDLPDYNRYENKYRPASGHIFGPVAILLLLGYKLDSLEVKNLISYFKNYLIAMQLNDDAHDWEEDMARGHLSTIVVLLLDDLKKAGWKKSTIDLVADLPELKKVFWFTTMKKYTEIALAHTKRSRKALMALDMLEDRAPLLRLTDITENAALQAKREYEKTEAFLNTYKK